MKRVPALLLAFLLVVPLGARAQDIELNTYTPEQRWQRASEFVTLGALSGMAVAKASGQSVEFYNKYMADMFVPGWGQPNTGDLGIVRGMHRNMVVWPDGRFEIVEQSDNSITVRVNRPWASFFGEDGTRFGVTLEEYDSYFDYFNARLADYKGLSYEHWIEDGWSYMKFSSPG